MGEHVKLARLWNTVETIKSKFFVFVTWFVLKALLSLRVAEFK